MLATTHELADGSRVRLRLTRPSDIRAMGDFLERLSPETRHRRFLTPMPAVSAAALRHFAFYDPRQRLVVAATVPIEGAEGIVGLAEAFLLSTGLAEIAIVVDDRHQGRGVGRVLSEAVASLAIRYGATHLKGEMLGGNLAPLRLMQRIGPTVLKFEDGGTVAYTKLPAATARAA